MTPNEKKLKLADYLGFTVIPTIASSFVATYWVLGMTKYYFPEMSIDAITGAFADVAGFVMGAMHELTKIQDLNSTTKQH